jgi:hypothetical protein
MAKSHFDGDTVVLLSIPEPFFYQLPIAWFGDHHVETQFIKKCAPVGKIPIV